MRIVLEKELNSIQKMLFEIFTLAKESLWYAINYILYGNEEDLRKVKALEEQSDLINLEIFEKCISVIATQQPVAKDLRFIFTASNISSFYERICDLSLEICDLKLSKLDEKLDAVRRNILWMVKKVLMMIELNENSLRKERTGELKRELEGIDSEIDKLFDETRDMIIDYLKECGEDIEDAVNMLYIIRYIERIGDIVAKTGSRIIYIEKGKHVWIK